jgi:hypothetical protein
MDAQTLLGKVESLAGHGLEELVADATPARAVLQAVRGG